MKILRYNKLSAIALLMVLAALCGGANAQTTDTVYHPVFGCDSLVLPANGVTYRTDTTVRIPHYSTSQGTVYMDVLNVYNITLGKSYSVHDTVEAKICSSNLPYTFSGHFFYKSGDYELGFPTTKGCDSAFILLKLNVMQGQRDTINLGICQGESSIQYEDITFDTPGSFDFIQGYDSEGCPIVKTYIVETYPTVSDTVNVQICQSELPYSFAGQNFNSPGTYMVLHTTEHGCLATTRLIISTLPSSKLRATIDTTICAADAPFMCHDVPYYTSGTYYQPLKNIHGCDSLLLTINLTVNQPVFDTVAEALCESSLPYIYNGIEYNDFGQYYIDNNPDTACSNFTVLQLTRKPSSTDTLVICTNEDSYTFYDSTFTASGTYTIETANSYQCTDKHILILTIKPAIVNDTVYATICSSEVPYEFFGSKYYSSGTYTKMVKNQLGCDSARVKLMLTVNEHPTINDEFTITRNDIPFTYRDSSYTESGVYTFRIPDTNGGCDTLVTMNLNVIQTYTVRMDTAFCANESISFLGETVSTAGEHEFTYHLADYDSVIVLNVSHYPTYQDETIYLTVGEYEMPYHFGDSAYTTDGYHEQTLKTIHGCDSVVSIHLTVNPAIINNDTIFKEICSNDLPYTIFDSVLTAAGVYRFLTPSTVSDYDSVFYVKLNVKESPALIVPDTTFLCTGNTLTLTAQSTGSVFQWSSGETTPSINVTLAGTYTVKTTNAYNCSTTASVHVIDADIPEINISGSTTLCKGSSTTLQAFGGSDYVWSNGATTDTTTVTPQSATNYSVTVTNIYGCKKTGNISINVNDLPTAEITGNTSICAGGNTVLTATGGSQYAWSNGTSLAKITVSTEGVYTVTASDINGCSNTATVNVIVNQLPVINVLGRLTFCQGGSTNLTATGGTSYQWNSGETSQTISVSYAGTYTVTGTDSHGCSATKNVSVTRDEVSATITGNRYFCHGQSTTLAVSDPGNYSYQWFDGSTTNNISISAPGQYSVTVTNANGCQSTLSATVSEYNMPAPVINGNMTICEGQSTTLRASGGNSYIWDDGNTSALISVNATGTYAVTVTNQYGCTASTSATVLVNPAPVVTLLSNDNICSGESVTLTAISNGSTFNWATGQTGATINVNPTTTTTYTVLVTDNNGCTTTASKTIIVNQPPAAYITGNTTICQGDTAHLQANGGTQYKWSTNIYSPYLNTPTAGLYTVTVTNDNGCSAILNANVVVNAVPAANVPENIEICSGEQTIITADAPVGCSYYWSTGSHQSQITVKDAGTYTVTVTNPNQCSTVYSTNLVVRSLPQVSIVGNGETCQGNSTMLTATSGAGTQFTWSTDETSATITVSESGQYTVTATNNYGCSATAKRNVVVHALPTPQISGESSVCKGSSTTLTATGGVLYNWNTGDATGSSVAVSPEASTTYIVTVTNAYGCSATASKSIVVNELPTITFSGNSTICQGSMANITASGAVNYAWSTGEATATAHISTPGYHKVTASNSYNCVNTDSVLIVVNANPVVTISGNDHICANTPTLLSAGGAQTYVWNTNDNSSSITISPSISTSYSVTGYDANGCSSTVTKNIVVEALPVVSIIGQTTICRGESTVLTAMGGNTYQWSTGAQVANISVSPNQTTTYTVMAFNTFGCSSQATATVNVNVLPSVIFSGNASICNGETATISVTGGNSYTWNNGNTGSTLTTGTAGVYKVTATNSLNCQRSDSIEIVVWSKPVINIDGDGMICSGSSEVLTATGGVMYSWSTGENTPSIDIMPSQTTTYTVTGYDEHGCNSTTSKVVNVEALPYVHINGILAICHGDSTELTASGGHTYLWSTGATSQKITVSEHSAYTVTATSLTGCQATASATVVNNPVPYITLNGVETICENTTETLSVSGDYDFLWSTGSTEDHIDITTGGNYAVTATNDYGCTSIAAINVATLTAPFVQILGVNSLCQDESTTLIASTNAISYEWNTGDSTQTVVVTPDNTLYEVTVTGTNGCNAVAQHMVSTLPTYNYTVTGSICEHQNFSQYGFEIPVIDTAGTYTFSRYLQTVSGCDSTINLLLTVNPLPRLDSITGPQHITQYGNSYYSINNPQFVNNYEWRVSNTHWTLINPDYSTVTMTVNTNGNGILTARGINNCGYTETSINIFCNVGIEDHIDNPVVKLYPNPVHQSLFINLENAADIRLVRLYDETGRLVFSGSCDDTTMEIDCTRFANGHYTVHFVNEKGNISETRKIIVNNR